MLFDRFNFIINHIISILASVGVIQACVLVIYLITIGSGKRAANWMLALVLFGLSIRIGKSIFNYYLPLEPWHRNVGLAGFLLVAPSYWLYGCLLFKINFRLQSRHLWHYLPAIAYFSFSWLIPNQSNFQSYLSYALVLCHYFFYLAFCFKLKQADLRDALTVFNLNWYRKILWGLVLIGCYYLLVFLSVIPSYIGGAIFYSLLIYAFFFIFMKRHQLIADKYSHSDLSEHEVQSIFIRFEQTLINEKPYLNPKYNLQKAAASIQTNPRLLSQAINQLKKQNFSEYINSFRVNSAQSMLSDETHKQSKIAIIGIECGFGNTTSFNQVFRTRTGMTPSEYRQFSLKKS